jgi:hypothetical protein
MSGSMDEVVKSLRARLELAESKLEKQATVSFFLEF